MTRAAEPSKGRILLITRNLPPLLGGMERFNERVVAQLAKEYSVEVCGPAGCEKFLPVGMKVKTVPIRPLPLFLLRAMWVALKMSWKSKPDVILAGSGLTAPLAWLISRINRSQSLVFLYGLDLAVANFWYQNFWLRVALKCDGFLPISRHTRQLALDKGIPAEKMMIVTPGVDQPTSGVMGVDEFRQHYDLASRPIMISVGRLTRRKGLIEFVRECLPGIVERSPDCVLVVVGGEPMNALAGNRGGVSEELNSVAESLGVQRNVMLLGSVSDVLLDAAYRASQVHVFPILDIPGDVEGFGIVALESAIHGLPTVAFAVGGVPDAISDGISGSLVAPGDYVTMRDSILGYLSRPVFPEDETFRKRCIQFAADFEWDKIGVKLRAAVSRLAFR